MNIYFLAHSPLADMNKSYAQFGKGLGSSQLEGAVINIKQFDKDPRNKDSKGDQTFWQIELKQYDEKHNIVNRPVKDRCRVGFRRALVRVFSEEATNTTLVEVKPEGVD